MNLGKKIAILTIAASVSLFAIGIKPYATIEIFARKYAKNHTTNEAITAVLTLR